MTLLRPFLCVFDFIGFDSCILGGADLGFIWLVCRSSR